MVCNWALQVRNQTVVLMNLRSLYHYHAEWPLKTEPWINAEGWVSPQRRGSKLSCCCCCCCCTQHPLPPAQDHCSESADLCLGSHQEVKDHWQAQAAPASVSRLSWPRSKTQRCRHCISHPLLHYVDNLKLPPSVWAVLLLFLLSPTILSSQTHCLQCKNHVPISAPTPQLLKPTLKSNQHVLQCCRFLLSAPLPCSSLSLFTLSNSLASGTDKQMLPPRQIPY